MSEDRFEVYEQITERIENAENVKISKLHKQGKLNGYAALEQAFVDKTLTLVRDGDEDDDTAVSAMYVHAFVNSVVGDISGHVANALKGSVSGNPICLGDVSPLAHEMKVKTNVGGATVQKYGRNLFDVGEKADYSAPLSSTIISIDKENQTITANGSVDGSHLFVNTKQKYPTGTYTVQAVKSTGTCRFIIRLYDENGTELTSSSASVGGMTYNSYMKGWFTDSASKTFTVPNTAAYWCFGIGCTGNSISTFSNIQVEVGATATEYEKVHCETYTADENGNVEGIIGNGADITLMAESGVVLSAEYNRDINKAFESSQLDNALGDISTALDELHAYAEALVNGGAE